MKGLGAVLEQKHHHHDIWHPLSHASRSLVPQPDVFWYRLNSMGTQKYAPKKVIVTLFFL